MTRPAILGEPGACLWCIDGEVVFGCVVAEGVVLASCAEHYSHVERLAASLAYMCEDEDEDA